MAEHTLNEAHSAQEEFEGKITPYLICSTPRAGGSILGEMLFATGKMGVPHEYFHKDTIAAMSKRWGLEEPLKTLSYLRKIGKFRTTPNGVMCIKFQYNQFLPIMAKQEMKDILVRTPLFIRIKRRDIIAQAVSYAIAHLSGAWTSDQKAKAIPKYDSKLVEKAMDEILVETIHWEKFFRLHDIQPFEVVYEDLFEYYQEVCEVLAHRMDAGSIPEIDISFLRFKQQSSSLNEQWMKDFKEEAKLFTSHFAP